MYVLTVTDLAGNQGFATVEYLSSALVDMKLHLAGNTPIDADKFHVAGGLFGEPIELVELCRRISW